MKKITKKEVLNAIEVMVEKWLKEDEEICNGVKKEDVLDYVNTTLLQLQKKSSTARAYAAKKKLEGDPIRDAVEAVLTDEFQTTDAITSKIDLEDVEVTKNKVTARLTQLIKMGKAHKTAIKVDGRKVMAYAEGPEPEPESTESEE